MANLFKSEMNLDPLLGQLQKALNPFWAICVFLKTISALLTDLIISIFRNLPFKGLSDNTAGRIMQ